jgi:hypothetical protein
MTSLRLSLPLLLALLVPQLALGEGFETVAAKAERVDALEPFLARYVGRCTDRYELANCQKNVAAARKEVAGKTFAVRVSDAASLVRPTFEGERFTLLFTPFVDGGGGFALTHGSPAKQDAAGRPVLGLIPIKGKIPTGTMEMEFQGPFRTGAVEVEIVFTPEKAWKMKRKGETGDLEGVAAKFLGVRVLDARTGKEIASRTL